MHIMRCFLMCAVLSTWPAIDCSSFQKVTSKRSWCCKCSPLGAMLPNGFRTSQGPALERQLACTAIRSSPGHHVAQVVSTYHLVTGSLPGRLVTGRHASLESPCFAAFVTLFLFRILKGLRHKRASGCTTALKVSPIPKSHPHTQNLLLFMLTCHCFHSYSVVCNCHMDQHLSNNVQFQLGPSGFHRICQVACAYSWYTPTLICDRASTFCVECY